MVWNRYDRTLQRKVSVYEHVILLAHGFCRPGLVSLLSKPEERDIFSSLIGLEQGNYENFLDCNLTYNLLTDQNFTAKQKMAMVMMMVKGESAYCRIKELSNLKGCYDKLFEYTFGNKFKAIQRLHLVMRIKEVESAKSLKQIMEADRDERESWSSSSLNATTVKLLTENLNMDFTSMKWFCTLSRIYMGDYRSFIYIANKLNISKEKSHIYRSICAKEYNEINNLFISHQKDQYLPLFNSINQI